MFTALGAHDAGFAAAWLQQVMNKGGLLFCGGLFVAYGALCCHGPLCFVAMGPFVL